MFETQPRQGQFNDAQRAGCDMSAAKPMAPMAEIRQLMARAILVIDSMDVGVGALNRKTDIAERDRQLRDLVSDAPAETEARETESLAYRIDDIERRVRAMSKRDDYAVSAATVVAVEQSVRAEIREVQSYVSNRLSNFQSTLDAQLPEIRKTAEGDRIEFRQRLEALRALIIPEGQNYGGEPVLVVLQGLRKWGEGVNQSFQLTQAKFEATANDIGALRDLNAQTAARATALEESLQGAINETGRAIGGVHARVDTHKRAIGALRMQADPSHTTDTAHSGL